ncbi:ABC transporter ATP-binding protein [Feifania hominis]|uniref:ABC transporter ATP-binding protein n=1 Tax=Feifania hominis TaxID=2763660 RepID=A0A926DES0_9FIRM|nr:ABC transporter ATP-binding protein [Feifania hominis]MBC8536866.1 ABC transporter ATP-binding protein [Feifania hominis]
MDGNILTVSNLSKTYPQFSLENVSFTLPSGSIMGFIGENGAGKTTTLKLILNLIRKESGDVTLFGLDHVRDERAVKEQIGVVLDDGFFYELLRPGQLPAVLKRVYRSFDPALYDSWLKRFDLPAGKPIKELSKGMKMKLSFAAALSHRPRLLILDEATSGLDPVMRSEILDLFLEFIEDESHAVLLSSHITSDLEKVADYITFIHEGHIVFSESKDEILERLGVLHCPSGDFRLLDREDVIGRRENQFGCDVLVHDRRLARRKYPEYPIDGCSLDDIMLYYVKGDAAC